MRHIRAILLFAFLSCRALWAETPVELALQTFLTSAPTPQTLVIWSSSSGYFLKGGADGKSTIGFSGLANTGYKVFLDENEIPTLLNGSFSLRVPVDEHSTKHRLRFVHTTEGEKEIFFNVRHTVDGKSLDHLELSWSRSEFKFFPPGWYNGFRINLIYVKLGSSGSAYSTQFGWAPTLFQFSKVLSVRANISGARLIYYKDETFFLLDTGLLFAYKVAPWTFELGPSLQAWFGHHGHQPAFSANVHYGFDEPILYVLDNFFVGYTYFLTRGIRAHEFKGGIEIAF